MIIGTSDALTDVKYSVMSGCSIAFAQ